MRTARAAAAAFLLSASPVWAAVPGKINYQGVLKESGVLVSGAKSMVFRLYDSASGGAPLWTSAASPVSLSTGAFRAVLQPTGVNWESGGRWLELEVEGTKLSPREELAAAPYSMNALLHSGKSYTYAFAAPASPSPGDLWYDSSVSILKFWSGSAWVNATITPHAASHAGGGSDPITSLGAAGMAVAIASSVSAAWLYGNGAGVTGVTAAYAPTAGVQDGTLNMGVRLNAGSLLNGPMDSSMLPSTAAFTSVPNTFTAGQAVTAGGGVSVAYGIIAGSATLSGGLTASSGTFTRTGPALFSLEASSGILAKAGGVSAPFFAGGAWAFPDLQAANLTGSIPAANLENSVVFSAGDIMTGALTLAADPVAAMQAATRRYAGSWTRPCVNPIDPNDAMVPVGDLCVDKYEASVWSSRTGGTQYGIVDGDYPCAEAGQDCASGGANPIYARSVSGVKPSSASWFQANIACANAGKHLLSEAEWQAAAAGTPDPGLVGVPPNCNTSDAGPTTTGQGGSCLSSAGAENMNGSMWEWVADWAQSGQNYVGAPLNWADGYFRNTHWPNADYGADGSWNIAASNYNSRVIVLSGLPAAILVGGGWGMETASGIFARYEYQGPSTGGDDVSFRCGRYR